MLPFNDGPADLLEEIPSDQNEKVKGRLTTLSNKVIKEGESFS